MSKRKSHNMRTRMGRALGAILRSNAVAVVNLDPSGRQGMVNWRNCKSILPGRRIADAVCDYAQRYYKAQEIAPQGIYKAEHLTDVIEQTYRAQLATCNPQHLVASGWIAIPDDVSMTEQQAAAVFEACGAWDQNPIK